MTDVVVIGAGPYGLSVAANLLRTGQRVRVFGRHMEAWRDHMPEGMVLKSDGFASNFGALPLTLEKFCNETGRAFKPVGHRTPLQDLIAYADAVRAAYVERLENVRVTRVDRRSDGFAISLDNGDDVFAKRVVCATGLTGFQRMPVIIGMPESRMTHVSAHHRLGAFAGQRVLTIGGGQSAFETSALLHENGAAVTVMTRRPPFWFDPESEAVPSRWRRLRHPNFGLGPGWRAWLWSEAPNLFFSLPRRTRLANAYSTFGPAGSGWLKHRVVDRIPVVTGAIRDAKDTSNGVQVTAEVDGQVRTFEVDHVIAATGYSSDLGKVPFLKPVLADISCLRPGLPELDRSFQTSLRGLHVVGNLSAASLGPSMRFIYGTNRAAPQLARALKRDAPRTLAGYSKAGEQPVSQRIKRFDMDAVEASVVAGPTSVDQLTSVPAVVQGIKYVVLICHLGRTGYNLQRALQAIGVRSYLVYDNRAASVRWSRGTTALHRTDDLDTADPVLIAEKINRLHRHVNICSVIPTDVPATLLLAKMLPLLTTPVFPTPDSDTLQQLDDKWEFAKICMAHGIAIPKTLFFRTNAEFDRDRIEYEVGYPAIIKPSVGLGQRNLVVLRNAQDAIAFQAGSSHCNGMVVQENVEGRDWSLSVLARDGVVTHVTAWECPPQLGKSYGVARFMTTSFRHHDELIKMGKDVVAATQFSGIANFDARLSPDGRMVLFECNPRFFNRMLAARMCGLNFVAAGLPGYSLNQQDSLTAGDYYRSFARTFAKRRQDIRLRHSGAREEFNYTAFAAGQQ